MTTLDANVLIRSIIAQYVKYGKEGSELIEKAYKYAEKCHEGVKRKSGEPYIIHPVSAAKELMIIQPDIVTIVATLVHDSVSDGTGSFDEIGKLFGPEVRRIVEALDKIGMVKYRGDKATIDRLQRTLIAMAQDVRSIFVKFADRIDNLRTLQYHSNPAKAQRIANESLSIYAPIATRLGLYAFKDSMETLALRELDLDGYLRVTGELAHYTLEQEQFLTQSVEKVRHILPKKYRESVSYRVKKPYSIYRKLTQQNAKSIRDIYDVFALRVIVDDIADCYAVLGIIHGHFTPLSERFKDFIAVPKPNGYQSLHTTVLGFEGYKQPIEIQIRTKEMDRDAEEGTAAHVLYKIHGDTMKKEQGYQDLVQMTMDALIEQGPMLGKKITFPTLFVFSPKGDVFELPLKSTPVDFAYAVHSDVGYHTVGARINGRIATLDTTLSNGDVVDIITSAQARPVSQWLDFVVSSKARSHIDIEIKRHSGDRARIVEKGRQALLEAFQLAGIFLGDDLEHFTQYAGATFDKKKMEELLYQMGQGIIKPSSFVPKKKTKPKSSSSVSKPTFSPEVNSVIVGGQKNIPHQLAQCCTPTFPGDVVAVLRTGGKCMIHSRDCRSLDRVNPIRILPAYWHIGDSGKVVSFTFLFHDTPGLLAKLTKICYQMGVNIVDINTVTHKEGTCHVHIGLEVPEDDISFSERFTERIRLNMPQFLTRDDDFFDKKK